jgi:hypothetical protein
METLKTFPSTKALKQACKPFVSIQTIGIFSLTPRQGKTVGIQYAP